MKFLASFEDFFFTADQLVLPVSKQVILQNVNGCKLSTFIVLKLKLSFSVKRTNCCIFFQTKVCQSKKMGRKKKKKLVMRESEKCRTSFFSSRQQFMKQVFYGDAQLRYVNL